MRIGGVETGEAGAVAWNVFEYLVRSMRLPFGTQSNSRRWAPNKDDPAGEGQKEKWAGECAGIGSLVGWILYFMQGAWVGMKGIKALVRLGAGGCYTVGRCRCKGQTLRNKIRRVSRRLRRWSRRHVKRLARSIGLVLGRCRRRKGAGRVEAAKKAGRGAGKRFKGDAAAEVVRKARSLQAGRRLGHKHVVTKKDVASRGTKKYGSGRGGRI